MEDNLRLFNSEHPRGSRYRDESYDKRSKLFRPKTRSGMRKIEAAGAAAFFATQDAVSTTPPNPSDRAQRIGAEVNGELLNYRLTHDIPWYITCIGALQDACKTGVVISKQAWVYEEVDEAYDEDEIDEMTGEVVGSRTVYDKRVVKDHPDIFVRPVENIRFSPAADWRDLVNTSPYFIDMEPWFIGDVLARIERGSQGEYDVAWRDLTKDQMRSARSQDYDGVRSAREQADDRYEDVSDDVDEHDIVWVHHNYMRIDGEDWYFATLGTEIMLCDPVPTSDTTPIEGRPYVIGVAALETHKVYPAGPVELGKPLQEEINDVTNLRIDNIRHILSPRYFVKRGQSIDMRSLLRNVPGGVTAMEDPKNDVHIRQIADATSSGYQEQDRLAVEYDELIGAFSQSSVAANYNINERVGNVQMLGEAANQITEMIIRTFSETWVEPVLQHVMTLEQKLESDAVVLAIIGQRMNMPAEQVFRLLELPVKVTVNVGFGATNPQKRLQKVAMAFQTLRQINPQWIMEADKNEVITEVLGAVGFKSAERFFPGMGQQANKEEDPRIQQLQQENEQLQQMLQGKQMEVESRLQGQQMQVESRERVEMAKLQYQQQKDQSQQELAHAIEEGKWRLAMLDHQIKNEQNAMNRQELVQQRIALNHTITMDERQFQLTQAQMEWQTGIDMPDGITPPKQAINPQTGEPGSEAKAQSPTPAKVSEPKVKEASVSPKEPRRIATQPQLGGDDKAGVIARGKFGGIPFKEG
jgi:hypothetical protein